MPAPLARRARRVTLYLFEDDCQQFERRYGRGWTEQVRLLVEKNCKEWARTKTDLEAFMKSQQAPAIANEEDA